jgi:hypothetical protein
MTFSPLPGFDWSRVRWGGPNERVAENCSYCGLELEENSVPLMLWKSDGSAARFCDRCQSTYWGIQSFPEDES